MAERRACAALAACLLTCTAAPASADWYLTPFFGWDFAANTTLIDLEYFGDNRTKFIFGGSAALITDGFVGIEVDYAFTPRFFQNPNRTFDPLNPNPPEGPTIISSHLQTLTGNVILAAPLTLTRESLRPFLVGGAGWMDATSIDLSNEFPVNCNMTAFNVGGGAIGMLGARAGLRFELRRFRGIGRTAPSCPAISSDRRLNLWRATVGMTLRY